MKIRFGMLATDAYGKAGGQCIQRRGSIRVLRNITIPTIRDASISNPQRLLNSRLFNGWAFLDGARRSAWSEVGLNLNRVNGWGESKALSGREAYTSLNSLYFAYTSGFIEPDTVTYEIPAFSLIAITIDVSSQTMEIELSDKIDCLFFQIKALTLRSNAVHPLIPKLKTIARVADTDDSSAIYNFLRAAFLTIVADRYFSIAIRGVSSSGLPSPWQTMTVKVIS